MPRGKRMTDAQKVAAILAKFEITTDEPLVIPEADYNHNNAVAMFARVPEHFVAGKCMECGLLFAHNQPIPAGTRVGYCSDGCRKRAFKKSTGIEWGAVTTSREPWDGDPPMIITPEQYANLEKIAEWFIQNRITLEIEDQEETTLLDERDDQEGYQYPKLMIPESVENDFDFGDPVVYVQESQYLVESQTIHQIGLDLSEPEQTFEEVSVFDFE